MSQNMWRYAQGAVQAEVIGRSPHDVAEHVAVMLAVLKATDGLSRSPHDVAEHVAA